MQNFEKHELFDKICEQLAGKIDSPILVKMTSRSLARGEPIMPA